MKLFSSATVGLALGLCVFAAAANAQVSSTPMSSVTPRPAAAAAPNADAPTLHVGSPAPPLHVIKWVKGSSIDSFKEGNVYVVEFWATWCGPCRTSIPHLTELAKKYEGKATMIGVSILEHPSNESNDAIVKLVEPFVKEMGDKMVYNVAVDGIDKTMAMTWMEAAGQSGIPSAFIVGRDRKIAWIGHPMEMDKPLDEVIAGTFDVQAEIARQTKAAQEQAELRVLLAPLQEAISMRDNAAIVSATDKILAVRPDVEGELMPVRFNALIQTDETAAFAYLKQLLSKGFFEKEPLAAYTASGIVMSRASSLKKPDYATLASALEKANGAMKDQPPLEAAYAEALFRSGNSAKAIEVEKQAIKDAEARGDDVPPAWLDVQKKKLAEYQSKK